MMFLSNNSGKISENGGEFKPYESMQPVSFSEPTKKDVGKFQAFHINGSQPSVFYPLKKDREPHDPDTSEDIGNEIQEKIALFEQEAYSKGFAQGEKDGIELGAAKSRKVIENIEALLGEVAGLREEILKQYEKDILEIICEIAGKVVHQQVDLNSTTVKETVMKVIHMTTEKRKIRLKVNPEDYEYIDHIKPDIFKRFTELETIVIEGDSSITRGGCYLESSCGDVDARIETQMEKIRKCLEEASA